MKIKVLLLALGCTMVSFGSYAQKGVANGTRFGSGEDSVRLYHTQRVVISKMQNSFGELATQNVLLLRKTCICMVFVSLLGRLTTKRMLQRKPSWSMS